MQSLIDFLLVDCSERKKEKIPFVSSWEVVDQHNCWWIEQVDCWEWEEKGFPIVLSWSCQSTQLLIDRLVDYHKRKEKGPPSGSRWKVVNHNCWSTLLIDCWERKEKGFFFVIELQSCQSINWLADITGWLLWEEGERSPLWIKSQSSWLTELLIDITCWLLGEKGKRILLRIELQINLLLIDIPD